MIKNLYGKVPFLQILLPLSAGILLSEAAAERSAFPLVGACVLLSALFFTGLLGTQRWNAFPCVVRQLALMGTFCCAGYLQMERSRAEVVFPYPPEERQREERLTGKLALLSAPFLKNGSYRCDAAVLVASDECWKGRKLRVYFKSDTADIKTDSTIRSLSAGSLLVARGLPRRFENFAGDFDYVSHMRRHGYTASVFLGKGQWIEISSTDTATRLPPLVSLRCRSERVRSFLVARYERWGITGANLALISTLSLGMKDLMDEESRQCFTSAGVAHLLAVSGMHVGIVCTFVHGAVRLLLFVLLLPVRCVLRLSGRRWFPAKRPLEVLRALCVTGMLWGYAFLAGLPASVIRAVLMFSFSAGAICVRRQNRVWNTLTMTAAVMLWCSPMLLTDIGFQMSFLSVASIHLLVPLFEKLLGKERSGRFEVFVTEMPREPLRQAKTAVSPGRILCRGLRAAGNWLVSSLLLSLSAQIGTAPLSLYHFHRFPRWFLLSNIALVPLSVGLTYMAMIFQLSAAIPVVPEAVVRATAYLLDGGLSLFTCLARMTTAIPGAVQENIAPGLWEMIPVYGGLMLMFFIMQNKSYLYTLENLMRLTGRRKYRK